MHLDEEALASGELLSSSSPLLIHDSLVNQWRHGIVVTGKGVGRINEVILC